MEEISAADAILRETSVLDDFKARFAVNWEEVGTWRMQALLARTPLV